MSYGSQNINDLMEEVNKHSDSASDRAAAIVMAADLEIRLREVLELYFIETSKKHMKEVFSGNGCAATFGQRINLCYLLGLVCESEFRDLKWIKTIRNDFAHKRHGLSFFSDEIKSNCYKLEFYNAACVGRPELEKFKDKPRHIFQIVAGLININLEERMKNIKRSEYEGSDTIEILKVLKNSQV